MLHNNFATGQRQLSIPPLMAQSREAQSMGAKSMGALSMGAQSMGAKSGVHPSASEIIPGIWIGDMYSASDPEFLLREKIEVVINCTKDLPFMELPQVKYRYRVPVHDNLQPVEIKMMSKFLGEIVKIINAYHQKGHRILIHCHAGMQRSACVFLVYHIQFHTKDFKESYNLVRSRRQRAFTPGINFLPAIKYYFRDYS